MYVWFGPVEWKGNTSERVCGRQVACLCMKREEECPYVFRIAGYNLTTSSKSQTLTGWSRTTLTLSLEVAFNRPWEYMANFCKAMEFCRLLRSDIYLTLLECDWFKLLTVSECFPLACAVPEQPHADKTWTSAIINGNMFDVWNAAWFINWVTMQKTKPRLLWLKLDIVSTSPTVLCLVCGKGINSVL